MNIDTLKKYEEDGWLISQTHPTLPLIIWNYSQKTQFESYWNNVTLMCRGLVTTTQGEIVALPFKKFFNIEENEYIPTSKYTITKKMDGSLIILFHFDGEWIIASRGSFTSDQVVWAREIIKQKNINLSWLNNNYTYLLELIYPENRIVVDYGSEKNLYILGAVYTKTGDELLYDNLKFLENINLKVVEQYDNTDYTTLKQKVPNNEEGYVVRFDNGYRVKIKGEEYVRLHRILSNLSTKSVWEALKNNDNFYDLLNGVPDEIYDKINKYSNYLLNEYNRIEQVYIGIYNYIIENENVKNDKKKFALKAKTYRNSQLLFAMYDNKSYSHLIWKILKPKHEKII